MMDKMIQYFQSVFSLSYIVFNFLNSNLKKLIFWRIGTSCRDQESLLPITVSNKSAQFNYSSSSIVNSFNTNVNNNWNLINNRHPIKSTNDNEKEQEPNYFEDMTPNLTKQKKVYINNQFNSSQYKEPNYLNYQSDRLNFDDKNLYQPSNDLGILDENNVGWENNEDLNSAEIDENMKILRQKEIERRISEHKILKMEKDLKKAKSQKSNFMATKIS